MAQRGAQPLPPMRPEELIAMLLDRVAALELRIASLEGAQGGALPGDYRFGVNITGDQVTIERVSTGGSAAITPPL